MKYIITTIFLIIGYSCIAQKAPVAVSSLSWMEGNWIRVNNKPGRTTYEHWKMDSPTAMSGKGLTLKGTDTTFTETLQILMKEDLLFYVAGVSHNSAPIYFQIEIKGQYSFISSNPDHDFPKQIAYKLEKDILTATISGDGKSIEFIFKRVDD